jgi:peptidoglycan/LPS O-acetylase OafA/YrhL
VFPLLMAIITNPVRAVGCLIAALLLASQWRAHAMDVSAYIFPWADTTDLAVFKYLSFPSQMPAFFVGILVYFCLPFARSAATGFAEIVLLASLIGIVYLARNNPQDMNNFVLLFGLAAACLSADAGRYLVNPLIRHIGRVSFSAYLLQWCGIRSSINLMDHTIGKEGASHFAMLFVITVFVTIILSTITYHLIEKPMILLGGRLIKLNTAAEIAPVLTAESSLNS